MPFLRFIRHFLLRKASKGIKRRNAMREWQSLAHVKRECKYHVVVVLKYRKKVMYGLMRKNVGKIIRQLCQQKEVELVEGHAMPDHVHLLPSVPPRYSISMVVGTRKANQQFISTAVAKCAEKFYRKTPLVLRLLRQDGRN
jgi:putative transposase